MSDTDIAAGAGDAPFGDLAELRAAHLAMMSRQSTPGGRPVPLESVQIRAFLRRAQATGAVLTDPEERGIAQRAMDYWCAELVAAGLEDVADPETVMLDPPAAVPATAEPAAEVVPRTGEDARQYIRLSALARQWRDSKGAAGYLLTGAALENARRFDSDPEIAGLIRASDQAQRQGKNRLVAVMAVVSLVLLGLLLLSVVQWKRAKDQAILAGIEAERATVLQQQAEAERQIALVFSDETKRLADERQQALDAANALAASRDDQRKAAEARLAELQDRQRLLDTAIAIIAGQADSGALSLDGLPAELRDETLASIQRHSGYGASYAQQGYFSQPPVVDAGEPSPDEWPDVAVLPDNEPAPDQPMTATAPDDPSPATVPEPSVAVVEGPFVAFRDDWLGSDLASAVRPQLTGPLGEAAFAGGELVPYLHYGIVMNAERRVAIYAAANLDRTLRNVLPAGSAPLRTDPRLMGAEPVSAWYASPDLLAGRLVERDDIAWGPGGRNVARVDAMVNALANTVPVTPPMQAAWAAVSDWVRTRHNANASPVVILAGPVLGDDAEPGTLPTALWKIALSRRDISYGTGPAVGSLVADAFIVDAEARDADDPEQYRTTVAQIAARTGLVFSPNVLAGDRGSALAPTGLGDALAVASDTLDAGQSALERDLSARLDDNGRVLPEQAKVVAALVTQLQDIGMLPPAKQDRLLSMLSLVPAAIWNKPEWRGLKADARRSVAALAPAAGRSDFEAQMQVSLNRLKDSLGLSSPPPQTVYLQFDQISRESAEQLRDDLTALGWTLPAVEGVKTAAGLKQVRYNPGYPEDEAAARLLAADIEALGWTGARAIPVRIIQPGALEIWVGNP